MATRANDKGERRRRKIVEISLQSYTLHKLQKTGLSYKRYGRAIGRHKIRHIIRFGAIKTVQNLYKKICTERKKGQQKGTFFTCGRRPAGLLATLVVVVVVGGGGNNFYTWVLGEPMYGFEKFKARSYIFVIFSSFLFQKPMYGLNAHVWS